MPTKRVTYADAGVNIDEANRATEKFKDPVRATHNRNVLAGIGAFGAMFKLPAGYKKPILVFSADGVGTKLAVAIKMGKNDTVGEDLVNHCVNDIAVQGAVPMCFLDYFASGKIDADVVAEVVRGMSKACIENRCALIGGETAEMPGFYIPGMYDVAGFITGVVERSKSIGPGRVKSGDQLFALPSTGLHTNGFSLARNLLFDVAGHDVGSYISELGCTVGEELLKVHRSYLRAIRALAEVDILHGAAHITGGGITDNMPRMLPKNLAAIIQTHSWEVPAVFELLKGLGNQPLADWRRTFNLGVGLICAISERHAVRAEQILNKLGEQPFWVGEVIPLKKSGTQLYYL
jgi:phosphoribosylformylglycinamidine cyclo-ligase